MEIRRIQVTGGSSYIISLPKPWITACNIQKGDPIAIIHQADGSLLITPKISSEHSYSKKIISVENIHDSKYLIRMLIGSYIMGYSEIQIKSSEKIPPHVQAAVVDFTHTSIGFEVIDENNYAITLKDLLNPVEMPFAKTIKRMYLIAEEMFKSAIDSLKAIDISLAESVIQRDKEIDRLYWLVNRQLNLVLTDITLSYKMETNSNEALYYFLISKALERIGDHAVRIAENIRQLEKVTFSDEDAKLISESGEFAIKFLSDAIDSWIMRDVARANNTIDGLSNIIENYEKLNKIAKKMKNINESIAVSYIAESIQRVGEYSADIGEVVVDFLMKKNESK